MAAVVVEVAAAVAAVVVAVAVAVVVVVEVVEVVAAVAAAVVAVAVAVVSAGIPTTSTIPCRNPSWPQVGVRAQAKARSLEARLGAPRQMPSLSRKRRNFAVNRAGGVNAEARPTEQTLRKTQHFFVVDDDDDDDDEHGSSTQKIYRRQQAVKMR